jgi:hypothetical protein
VSRREMEGNPKLPGALGWQSPFPTSFLELTHGVTVIERFTIATRYYLGVLSAQQ